MFGKFVKLLWLGVDLCRAMDCNLVFLEVASISEILIWKKYAYCFNGLVCLAGWLFIYGSLGQ